jgi:hypothetical protein
VGLSKEPAVMGGIGQIDIPLVGADKLILTSKAKASIPDPLRDNINYRCRWRANLFT